MKTPASSPAKQRKVTADRRTSFLSTFVPSLADNQPEQSGLVALPILITLRWVLLAGQGAALLVLFFRAGAHPNLGLALGLILVSSALNLYLRSMWRSRAADRAWITNREAANFLAFDLFQIALLLFFTGGILNPFVILLLAPATVSALALSRRATSALIMLTLVLLSLITLFYVDLPWRNRTGAVEALILPLDYRAAIWTAMVITVVFLSLFVSWQAELARKTARALGASRLALDREQELAKIGALAAAAAHELGTPLATIAVIASDLADQMGEREADADILEDTQMLLEETRRCRAIIASMAVPANGAGDSPSDGHELYLRQSPEQVLRTCQQTHGVDAIAFTLTNRALDDSAPPDLPRQGELIHGLGNIVQNAFQFAQSEVQAEVNWDADTLHITLRDDGPGFPTALLDRLGEPYLRGGGETGRQTGRPSMGLGLFIATSLLRHSGGHVEFRNIAEKTGHSGAEVSVSWSRPI